MSFKEYYENLEEQILSPYATKSRNSKGRERPISPCEVRTEFSKRSRSHLYTANLFGA